LKEEEFAIVLVFDEIEVGTAATDASELLAHDEVDVGLSPVLEEEIVATVLLFCNVDVGTAVTDAPESLANNEVDD
jgi:hypothetical protein